MDSDNSDFVFVHFPQRKKRVKKAVAWEYVSSPKDKVCVGGIVVSMAAFQKIKFLRPFFKNNSVSLRQLMRYANLG